MANNNTKDTTSAIINEAMQELYKASREYTKRVTETWTPTQSKGRSTSLDYNYYSQVKGNGGIIEVGGKTAAVKSVKTHAKADEQFLKEQLQTGNITKDEFNSAKAEIDRRTNETLQMISEFEENIRGEAKTRNAYAQSLKKYADSKVKEVEAKTKSSLLDIKSIVADMEDLDFDFGTKIGDSVRTKLDLGLSINDLARWNAQKTSHLKSTNKKMNQSTSVGQPRKTVDNSGASDLNKFKSTLSASAKKYLTSEGLGKRLEASISGIKPGVGSRHVETSANQELQKLFSWAKSKGYKVFYDQISNGKTEKYQFYVMPEDEYEKGTLEENKKNSYTFSWVAPDEFGRLSKDNLGSTTKFFYDATSDKFSDLNTWGLAQNVSTIMKYGAKKPSEKGYKTLKEINNQLSAQMSSTRESAPVNYAGEKDIDSLFKWDSSDVSSAIASNEEKARANSLMTWAATLSRYFSRNQMALQEAQGWVGKEFAPWEIPQTIQNILHRYLMYRSKNPEGWQKAIKESDDDFLKKFIASPEFVDLQKSIDNYFGLGAGYFVDSLSHGSSSTGKAFPSSAIDVPFTDIHTMQVSATENTSKSKANSLNRYVAEFEDLIAGGFEQSSLRDNSTRNTSSLVIKQMRLPAEILQKAINLGSKQKYREGVSEERLFGDEKFSQLGKYYANPRKREIDAADLNNKFLGRAGEFVDDEDLLEQVANINEAAIGTVINFNKTLTKETTKDIKASNELTIPKGSFVTSIAKTEHGIEVEYVSVTDLKQGQKFVDTATGQRHEYGEIKRVNVIQAINEDENLSAEEKESLIDAIKGDDIHLFTPDVENKRASSTRVNGAFNEGLWEYLVNQIKTKEQFNEVAKKHQAFGARYSWEEGKGVISNLHLDDSTGLIATNDKNEALYYNDAYWSDVDDKLIAQIKANNGDAVENLAELLPKYRAAYMANTMDSLDEDGKGLSSMYLDVAKTVSEMGLMDKNLIGKLTLNSPHATSVAEYSEMSGLGLIGVGESAARFSTRVKENVRDRLTRAVKGNKITQAQADAFLKNITDVYGGEERKINEYNATVGAARNLHLPGSQPYSLVFADKDAELEPNQINLNALGVNFELPEGQEITDEDYNNYALNAIYRAVEAKGGTLGVDTQVQLSFAGLDQNTIDFLNDLGFRDGQILGIGPEMGSVNGTRQVAGNDRATIEYLKAASDAVKSGNIDKTYAKKITNNGKTGAQASATYQRQMASRTARGGDLYKEAAARKAQLSGNFKVVAGNEADFTGEDAAFGVISAQGARDLLKLGRSPKNTDIDAAFESIYNYIQSQDSLNTLEVFKDLNLEDFKQLDYKNKKQAYKKFIDDYIQASAETGTALPTFLLRNPVINESNVLAGLKINTDVKDGQAANVLLLPKLVAELLNGDFDGDIVQAFFNLASENMEVATVLFEQMKQDALLTQERLKKSGEWDKEGKKNSEAALDLIKEAEMLVNPQAAASYTASVHQAQEALGLSSYRNTDTRNKMQIWREKNHADESQYIKDEVYRSIASQMVEQMGISAKKTQGQILQNPDVAWDPGTLTKLADAVFNYTGSEENEEILKRFELKTEEDAKVQEIIQALINGLGEEAVLKSGILDTEKYKQGILSVTPEALREMFNHAAVVNADAEKNRKYYSRKTDELNETTNPDMIAAPGRGITKGSGLKVEGKTLDEVTGKAEEHVEGMKAASKAEADKVAVSELLVKALKAESKEIENEDKKIQQHVNSLAEWEKASKFTGATALNVKRVDENGSHYYVDDNGNRVMSATQYVAALKGTEGDKYAAERRYADEIYTKYGRAVTAADYNKDETSFRAMIEGMNSATRGNIVHEVVDLMAKSGRSVENLKNGGWKDLAEGSADIRDWKNELFSKFGLGEEFIQLEDRIEGFLGVMEKLGLSFTDVSEKAMGVTLHGNQGDIKVAFTLDQLLMGQNGELVLSDTKNFFPKGEQGVQLGIEALGLEANKENFRGILPNEALDKLTSEITKLIMALTPQGASAVGLQDLTNNRLYAALTYANSVGRPLPQTGETAAMGRIGVTYARIDNPNYVPSGRNKSVNDYIRTYKMLLKAQEDVQRAEIKSQGKSGNDLINAQALVKAAKDREILLQSQLGTLDLTAMTLNGEKLTEEQIIKLKKEIGRADASHLAKQAAITASVREEQGFLQKLVGGFKQQITGFIDTSLAYQAIGRIRSAIHQLIQTTVQLDAALVDIQIATGNTRKETRDLMISYSSLAKEMGRTTVEVTQASNDWLRAGYEGQEAAELTRASMMLSTLGMIEASQATTYLISTLKGWKLEASEVIGVVDKLSAVDMSAAISAGDLALAMSRANNSARLAGVDMNKFIGYVTTVADVTQKSAESVGESFKTIFSRFGNVKAGKFVASYEDTQSADYSEDEWTNLNDIETVLGRIGIKIRENAKDWRNVDDILSEIGEKWATWDKTTQNAVATAIAGTRQRENVLTLFANWDDVSKYAEIAENAYGTATQKMEAYTQSVEASKNRMTVAIENWALSLNQSDTIRAFYDSLTFIVENIHTLALAFGGLAAALNIKSVANFFGSTWTKFGKKMIDMSNLLGKARQGYQSSRGFMETAKENLQNYAQQRDIAYFSDELEAKYHNVLDKEILAKVQLLQSDLFGIELKDKNNVAILLSTEATEEATVKAWESISKDSTLTLAKALLNTATEEERAKITQLIATLNDENISSEKLAATKTELARILEGQKSSGALQGGVGGFVGKNIQADNSYAKQMATGIGATIGMMAGGFAGKTFSSSFAKAVNLDSDTFGIVGTMIGSSIGMAIGPKIVEVLMSGGGLSTVISSLGPWGIAAGVAIAAGAALGISQKMDAKALERAQNAFKESENNLNEAKGAQKLAKQFDELSAGVDRFGNNVSLSEEDYDKFLEISNQLGSIFPELIRYTDEEGNKIIGASDGVKNLSSEVSTLYDNLVKIADLDLLQDANVNDAISKAHNDIKDYENDIIKLQVERDQVEKFGGIPTGDYSISTGKMNFSRVFDTEEEKAHYIAELDSQIDNIQNKINKVPQQLQSYVQAILRQEVEGYDDLSDEARQALQSTLNNISLDGIQTVNDLEDRVQEMALKVQKTFKENPALISLISDTYEAETVGELMEARENLMAQLSQVFGADGWDDTEKKILIAWGFKYDEESGNIFDSQNLGSQIQQALMGQGMSEQGAATWMARTGITNRSVDEGQKIFGYINSGAVNWNTSGRVLDNLINSDSYGGGTLQGALDYSQSLAESTVGIREQLHEFYSNVIEDGEVTRAAVTNAFSTVPENVRESIYQSSESLLEQFDTVEEASKAMEEEISDNFANISESLLNSQKEVASQMAARSFSNIDRGEDNIIGEWSEIAQMLDKISTSYDKLGVAQQEQAIAGRLSWETTLDLLNTNIDYLYALEVTEEGIKLKTNAEEIMSEVQLQAAKANIEAKIAELEAENLRLQEIIAGVNVTDAAAMATVTSNNMVIESLNDVNQAWAQATEYARTYWQVAEGDTEAQVADVVAKRMKISNVVSSDKLKILGKELNVKGKDIDREQEWIAPSERPSTNWTTEQKDAFHKLQDNVQSIAVLKELLGDLDTIIDNGGSGWDKLMRAPSGSGSGGNDSKPEDDPEDKLKRLKAAIGALNKEYEQMMAYQKEEGKLIPGTAAEMRKKYYEQLNGLLQKQAVELLKLAAAQKDANGNFIADENESTLEAEQKHWEYMTDYEETIVKINNLDDEEINDVITMIEAQGILNDNLIKQYQLLLDASDTLEERIENQEKLNKKIKEQKDLAITLLQFERELLDYRLQYLEASPGSDQYNQIMEQERANLQSEMGMQRGEMGRLYQIAYDKVYQNYIDNGYTDAVAREKAEYEARQDKDFQSATKSYIAAYQKLGELAVKEFEDKINVVQKQISKLQDEKPKEWAGSWSKGSFITSAFDKINAYYDEANKLQNKVLEEAQSMLDDVSDLTDKQIEGIVDKANSAIKAIHDNAIQRLEDTKQYQESTYNALVNEVNRYIKQIEKQKEIVEDAYDKELEKLQDKEDAIERTNKLLSLQNNLQNAQQEKQRVYRQGIGWVEICAQDKEGLIRLKPWVKQDKTERNVNYYLFKKKGGE